jgi:hypothetical protein
MGTGMGTSTGMAAAACMLKWQRQPDIYNDSNKIAISHPFLV